MGSLSFAGDINKPVKAQTSAVMSNNCTPDQIKKLAGDAVIKINPTPNNPGTNYKSYNITLDINKMDFGALTKKMLDAGCF